jgi:hypothetical protein
MYDYNTAREPMKLREFGRNVQNLANYIATLESKEERNKYSAALVELMKQIVPSAKANQESNQLLWDDLHILADFNLDIDAPFPPPEQHVLAKKPERIGYGQGDLPFRHYGRNVLTMIEEAKKMENEEEKEVAVFQVARLMKTFHMSWNRETPENELIAKNIEKLSGGELKLNLEKAAEYELLEPLYKDKPKTNQQRSARGKNQNRRRR